MAVFSLLQELDTDAMFILRVVLQVSPTNETGCMFSSKEILIAEPLFDSSTGRSVIVVYFHNFGTRCTFFVCRSFEV